MDIKPYLSLQTNAATTPATTIAIPTLTVAPALPFPSPFPLPAPWLPLPLPLPVPLPLPLPLPPAACVPTFFPSPFSPSTATMAANTFTSSCTPTSFSPPLPTHRIPHSLPLTPPVQLLTAPSAVVFKTPALSSASCTGAATCAALASVRRRMPLRKRRSLLQVMDLSGISQARSVRMKEVESVKKWDRVVLVRAVRRVSQVGEEVW